jgi:hypothetical protein
MMVTSRKIIAVPSGQGSGPHRPRRRIDEDDNRRIS